ncbi:MAG: transcriptional repressor [Myxococcota bacterium]
MAPPFAAQNSPRRHRSRQRERLLHHLRRTTAHPTAAEIHAALRSSLPALALGTVYRNLELLVAEGRVHEVPTASGALRYDGRLDPHDHFECEACGRLFDVQACAPTRLARALERRHGLVARRVRVAFVGTCRACIAAGTRPLARSIAARPPDARSDADAADDVGPGRSARRDARAVASRSQAARAPSSRSRTGSDEARSSDPQSTKEGSRWPI